MLDSLPALARDLFPDDGWPAIALAVAVALFSGIGAAVSAWKTCRTGGRLVGWTWQRWHPPGPLCQALLAALDGDDVVQVDGTGGLAFAGCNVLPAPKRWGEPVIVVGGEAGGPLLTRRDRLRLQSRVRQVRHQLDADQERRKEQAAKLAAAEQRWRAAERAAYLAEQVRGRPAALTGYGVTGVGVNHTGGLHLSGEVGIGPAPIPVGGPPGTGCRILTRDGVVIGTLTPPAGAEDFTSLNDALKRIQNSPPQEAIQAQPASNGRRPSLDGGLRREASM